MIAAAAAAWGVLALARHYRLTGDAPRAVLAALPMLIQVGTAAVGGYLLWIGWPRRIGREPHCGRCGYHQEQEGPITGACPECGYPWRWMGWSKPGRPIRKPWALAAGSGLLALTLAGAFLRAAAPWVLLRLLPDEALLQRVALLPDTMLNGEWEEVERRRFPAATLDALARPLLNKRDRFGLSPAAERTLFAAVTRPGAPADLAAAYFAPLLTAELKARDRIQEGEPLQVRTDLLFRGPGGSPAGEMAVLSALLVDGNPSSPPTHEWPVRLVPSTQKIGIDDKIDPLRPGRRRIRRILWVVWGPAGYGPVAWAGAQPTLPTGVTIVAQQEVERWVEVVPAEPKR